VQTRKSCERNSRLDQKIIVGKMQTTLEPVGTKVDWLGDSEISEILYTHSGLRIVVAALGDVRQYTEIYFGSFFAFQAMEEYDMPNFSQPPDSYGHVLFKVMGDGWRKRVKEHYLQVSSSYQGQEWLIVSGWLCVSVLSDAEPNVRAFGRMT
jgi:hypothetical protein